MTKRSDTVDNLNRISHISERAERKPLNATEFDPLTSESGTEDEPSDKEPDDVSTRLRNRLKVVKDEDVEKLDRQQISWIIKALTANNARRVARSKRAGGSFKSNFADITVEPVQTTIFDAEYFKKSQFYGFYIFFWLATGFLIFQNAVHAYFDDGMIIFKGPVFGVFLTGLFQIAITDLFMYLSMYVVFWIQHLCLTGWILWHSSGWLLQSAYEVAFFVFWVLFTSEHVMDFQWIGRVFLVMHMLVFLMKMHSYGFYNGYLWSILRELEFSEKYLHRIHQQTAVLPEKYTEEHTKKLLLESIAFCRFELLHQSVLLDKVDKANLDKSLEKLQLEGAVKFPGNIGLHDFFMYTMFPTVVYELVYARTKTIRWKYVAEKLCAIFGVIFLMLFVAEHSIYPLVLRCDEVRTTYSVAAKWRAFGLILIDMIPPFMTEYLLVFFLIWDSITNAIAELGMFADRDFYGPWWSCTDWEEYSRLWNKPVHRFLLRHVYHSSISAFSLNRLQASVMTFAISGVVHELVMYVIFRRLRGYLMAFQLGQIPLVMFSRSPLMRDKKVLGNVICWFGFFSGPAIICTLYLVF